MVRNDKRNSPEFGASGPEIACGTSFRGDFGPGTTGRFFSHEKTQESSECLRHLTQQAVVLQKKMNDIYSNGKLTTGLPPIHIQPPSMGSVLDMLNAINGIIFVQISSKEIANLKNEIEKRQKEGGAAGESSVAQANQEEVDNLLTETMAKTRQNIPRGTEKNTHKQKTPLFY
ncbi:clustered mitochondria protein homolog [Culex quinquefasciatus]|uniref:clustered mitochondria protein homolog n=1 Tax=Culex quinquefasciatus TaxID=7176 RepID=UPI0018E33460|nr:clustered mitochondria protein homolog [Culex quinquefasciatus]